MNEVLIEKLFIEAQKQITSKTTKDFANKFTELIVKECMDVAKDHTPDTEECEYTWLIHDKIKQHFGVEE